MKGGGGDVTGVAPAKRRWISLVIGVLFLVVLSMLVPLGFLLGLNNGFHSHGFVPVQHASQSSGSSNHIDDLRRKIDPKLPNVQCMTLMMTGIAYTLLCFIFC